MPRFHPQVRRDVSTAIRHYDSISDALGDDFWAKFEQVCLQVETYPERFHFDPSGWWGGAAILKNSPITCCSTKNSMECES